MGGLLQDIALGRVDGSYRTVFARLSKADLLILDDFGLAPLAGAEAREPLEVIDDRYERRSTVVCSQLPLGEWHRAITDPTLADAILDRLVHGAHKFTLSGESMRKKKGGAQVKEPDEGATL
jgi:DNA replication protein DnaC